VIPTVGSKELVALLPTLLGLRGAGTVLIPEVAYPTYEVGAVLAGLTVRRTDAPPDDAAGVVLVWLNSPGNPHGRVLTDDELRAWVAWGRAHGVPVVADECYVTLGWDVEPRSVLHPSVAGDDHTGLLAVHSLSKQSTAAGYRAGLLSGDPALVRQVWEVRRHLGLLVPTPVQAAMTAGLADDAHVDEQRERYRARRDRLAAAVRAAGARIDHSEAGLYLWVTRDEDCWTTIDWLAGLGIVAAPGSFYGPAGGRHVRMALTATDERIDAAVERLAG
jgi:succinyldiaminopimelate transaminase